MVRRGSSLSRRPRELAEYLTTVASSIPTPILFVHFGDPGIRGSEQVLINLLTHLDPARVRPIVWCNQQAMAEAARAIGCLTYRSDFQIYFDYQRPKFRLDHYRGLMHEARELISQHQIRVLHSNSAGPCQWLVPVARNARLPLLAHLHAHYLRRSRYVLLLHQASLVGGVSRQIIQPLLDDGMAPSRVRAIYNGIDFPRLRPKSAAGLRRQLGIPQDATIISAVGQLVEMKGQDLLIRALGRLDRGRDIRLLIAGDGPERIKLQRLAQALGVQEWVRFLGHCHDVGAAYAASDIFAHSSRAEGFGLVLAEAGYFGLPVVATTVGGIPEVVEDGVTGLLVPPDDPPALAAALSRLIDDREYRQRLGRAGKLRVEEMFGVERMVADFQQAYERLDRLPREQLGWRGGTATLKSYLALARRHARAAAGDFAPPSEVAPATGVTFTEHN
jgi:L-malate glycosyltransferase